MHSACMYVMVMLDQDNLKAHGLSVDPPQGLGRKRLCWLVAENIHLLIRLRLWWLGRHDINVIKASSNVS